MNFTLIGMRKRDPHRKNVENILAICLPIVTMQHIRESPSASHFMSKSAWNWVFIFFSLRKKCLSNINRMQLKPWKKLMLIAISKQSIPKTFTFRQIWSCMCTFNAPFLIHSFPKETQHFWSWVSFGEECIPVNLWLYIILTMLMLEKWYADFSWPQVTWPWPGAPGKIHEEKLRIFWKRL